MLGITTTNQDTMYRIAMNNNSLDKKENRKVNSSKKSILYVVNLEATLTQNICCPPYKATNGNNEEKERTTTASDKKCKWHTASPSQTRRRKAGKYSSR